MITGDDAGLCFAVLTRSVDRCQHQNVEHYSRGANMAAHKKGSGNRPVAHAQHDLHDGGHPVLAPPLTFLAGRGLDSHIDEEA